MKMNIKNLIIVEGKDDQALLTNYINALIVKTNGYDISNHLIKLANHSKNILPCLIMTDPDASGEEIRQKLHAIIRNYIDINTSIYDCDKNSRKKGIAETKIEKILEKLRDYSANFDDSQHLAFDVIKSLSKEKLTFLANKINLEYINKKQFIKELNFLGYDEEEIANLICYGNK